MDQISFIQANELTVTQHPELATLLTDIEARRKDFEPELTAALDLLRDYYSLYGFDFETAVLEETSSLFTRILDMNPCAETWEAETQAFVAAIEAIPAPPGGEQYKKSVVRMAGRLASSITLPTSWYTTWDTYLKSWLPEIQEKIDIYDEFEIVTFADAILITRDERELAFIELDQEEFEITGHVMGQPITPDDYDPPLKLLAGLIQLTEEEWPELF